MPAVTSLHLQTTHPTGPTVYRVYDATGRLIYVGATSNLTQRLNYHRTQAWWWSLADRFTAESHVDMTSAHAAEWAAIATEDPAFNLARKPGRPSSKPRLIPEADAQVARDWLKAKGKYGGLPMPLRWIKSAAA